MAALVRGQLWGTPREQKDSLGPPVDQKAQVAGVLHSSGEALRRCFGKDIGTNRREQGEIASGISP